MPFTFLLALGSVSVLILFCVNVDKSRRECRQYLEDEAFRVYGLSEAEVMVVGDPRGMDGVRPMVYSGEKTA